MAIVDVDGSSQFSADSQPKLIGLVWGLAATQRSVCIHQIIIISRMPMSNELDELSQWFWSWWPHHEHCCVYYYYYTKNVGSQLVTYFIFHYVFDLRLETWWDLPLKTWDLLVILCCRAARDDWRLKSLILWLAISGDQCYGTMLLLQLWCWLLLKQRMIGTSLTGVDFSVVEVVGWPRRWMLLPMFIICGCHAQQCCWSSLSNVSCISWTLQSHCTTASTDVYSW